MKKSLVLLVLCVCVSGVQAEIFKWVDADGKVHYGDAPPKDAKTSKVSGGVTVVPAMAPPPLNAESPAVKEADKELAGTRGGISRKPAAEPEAKPPVAAASTPAELAAAARAAARQEAIERCRANKFSDCENVVDAQQSGFVPMPGWSQPPIRPTPRHEPPSKPRESTWGKMADQDSRGKGGPKTGGLRRGDQDEKPR